MADDRNWLNLGDYCRVGSLLLDGSLVSTGLVLPTQTVGALSVTGSLSASGTVNFGGFAKVGPGNFTTTVLTPSLAGITGLTFNTVANAVYRFTACLSINSSTVAGMAFGVNHSGAGATVEAQAIGQPTSQRISALNTATAQFDTNAIDAGVVIEGLLTVGANPGVLSIQAAKIGSGTATVYAGSTLEVWRVA